VERSFANLPAVQTTTFAELSAHDVIRADWLVFSDRTLPTGPSDFSGTHGTGSDDELDTPAPAAAPAAKKAPAEKAASPAKKAAATKKAKAAAEDAEQALEAIEAEAEIELPASDTDTDTVSDTDTEEAGTDA
jgi:hypothetical protein